MSFHVFVIEGNWTHASRRHTSVWKCNDFVFSCCWGNTSPPKQMRSSDVFVISRW